MMKKYVWGAGSREKIGSLHQDLQQILHKALPTSPVDFGIGQGARTFQEQLDLYLQGRETPGRIVTKLDPRNSNHLARAKHVIYEGREKSEAFDIYAWVPGRSDLSYDKYLLTLIAGHIMGTAKELLLDDTIAHYLRWGGNWDNNGEIITDQEFDDLPHFELLKV